MLILKMTFSDCIPFLCCKRSLEDICFTLGFVNIFIRMIYYFMFKFKILMLLTQSCKYCMNFERILRILNHKIFVVGGIGFFYICAILMPDLVAIKTQINLILGANQVRRSVYPVVMWKCLKSYICVYCRKI